MRRTVIVVGLLGLALAIQLTVLNGLRLPGGGVPDIVLVLVAALAMTDGPVRGMVIGFLAGLSLDLAPPGSAVFGEYALVFCLVGWAAGKLSGLLDRSALASAAVLAAIVAAGEVIVAGLSRALDPAQVDLSDIRHVLPYAVAYDVIAVPFALLLAGVISGRATGAANGAEAAGMIGPGGSASGNIALPGPAARLGRKAGRHQPHQPRLSRGLARPHGGVVGSGPGSARQPGGRAGTRPVTPKLRLAGGMPGSAARQHGGVAGPGRGPGSGQIRRTGMPARGFRNLPARPPLGGGAGGKAAPVNLHLASRRRRAGGVLGNPVGTGHGSLHAGTAGRGSTAAKFRPHPGAPGGSATGALALGQQRAWRRPVSLNFRARPGDASLGRLFSTALALPRPRKKAAPRFRKATASAPAALRASSDPQAILAARRRTGPAPRLRLTGARRGQPVIGGAGHGHTGGSVRGLGGESVHSLGGGSARGVGGGSAWLNAGRSGRSLPGRQLAHGQRASHLPHGGPGQKRPASPRFQSKSLAGPARRAGKKPQFSYGRRSVLSFLMRRRVGGRWLANRRVGTRSGVWLISKRAGGPR